MDVVCIKKKVIYNNKHTNKMKIIIIIIIDYNLYNI